jgi:hypothetical protein
MRNRKLRIEADHLEIIGQSPVETPLTLESDAAIEVGCGRSRRKADRLIKIGYCRGVITPGGRKDRASDIRPVELWVQPDALIQIGGRKISLPRARASTTAVRDGKISERDRLEIWVVPEMATSMSSPFHIRFNVTQVTL